MFGLIRKSTHDARVAGLEAEIARHKEEHQKTLDAFTRCQRSSLGLQGDLEDQAQAYFELDDRYRQVFSIAREGGVDIEAEGIETAADAVRALIQRVHAAASAVSEGEKLEHFNRGMLAEREAAKKRHTAA